MPLFFMVSGYLWSSRRNQIDYKRLLLRDAKRYIIPYVILCGINLTLEFVLSLIAKNKYDLDKYILGILYSRGTTEWMPNCSPLWFLTAILIALSVFDAVQRVQSCWIRFALIGAMGVCSALLSHFNVFKLPWNIDTAMMGTVFVTFGFLMKQYGLLQRFNAQSFSTKTLLIILFTFVGYIAILMNPVESVDFDGNPYGNVILMLIGSIPICFVLFYLSYRTLWKGLITNYLSWLGQHTIFIMGFDYFSGSIARGVLEKVEFDNWASVFVLKAILLTIGCLLWNWAVSKIKNKSIRQALAY